MVAGTKSGPLIQSSGFRKRSANGLVKGELFVLAVLVERLDDRAVEFAAQLVWPTAIARKGSSKRIEGALKCAL